MYWLFGLLVSLDAYLPRPGWRGEGLGLHTGQGTLPSIRTGGGGRRVSGGVGGTWEEVEILNGIIYKAIKNKKNLSWWHNLAGYGAFKGGV